MYTCTPGHVHRAMYTCTPGHVHLYTGPCTPVHRAMYTCTPGHVHRAMYTCTGLTLCCPLLLRIDSPFTYLLTFQRPVHSPSILSHTWYATKLHRRANNIPELCTLLALTKYNNIYTYLDYLLFLGKYTLKQRHCIKRIYYLVVKTLCDFISFLSLILIPISLSLFIHGLK